MSFVYYLSLLCAQLGIVLRLNKAQELPQERWQAQATEECLKGHVRYYC